MKTEFTGRHMTMILVGGFGIVVAVNFYMASLATGGFGGVVVQNSYVASQKYNGWLEAARAQEELGWNAAISRADSGQLEVSTQGLPADAAVSMEIRRPLGAPESAEPAMTDMGEGVFATSDAVPEGRWIVRVQITAGEDVWRKESQLQ